MRSPAQRRQLAIALLTAFRSRHLPDGVDDNRVSRAAADITRLVDGEEPADVLFGLLSLADQLLVYCTADLSPEERDGWPSEPEALLRALATLEATES